ncbi:hypothetical protein VNO77_21891 [Canavalia gladiata]|uniref:Uncharacterized protein n=1 Tax=Canavalia gladiata TaxID=3824 RepID=A0AAN9Q7J3_CANGL
MLDAVMIWVDDSTSRVTKFQDQASLLQLRPSQKYLMPNTKFRQCVQGNGDLDQSATKFTAYNTFPRENLELENLLIKSISKTGRREIFQCGQLVSPMHDKIELQGDDDIDINLDKRMTEE